MTRADEGEGREPGRETIREQRDAALTSVARLTAAIEMNAREVAGVGLPDEAKWLLAAKDQWQRAAALANERAAKAEAEVARLTQERDEALCLAEGPSTLLDLARGSVSRGMEVHAAEAEVARLTAALAEAEASDAESLNLYRNCRDRLEASASALRERVATLEAALKPFCFGDAAMEQILFGSTPDSAQCNFTIKYGHVRAARTALEAPHDDK